MSKIITLDAMIPRADLAIVTPEIKSGKPPRDLGIRDLIAGNLASIRPNLRKPDFQRETNHWDVNQCIAFLRSFLDGELVPAIILWDSHSHVFVVDGAHRLSALIAWIEDDYGDGKLSREFYQHSLSIAQTKNAKKLRETIHKEIGSFMELNSVNQNPLSNTEMRIQRAKSIAARSLDLQWVEGSPEKAESSFFNINKQGTPLDKIEERIIKARAKPAGIAARSIIRSAKGHKYWSSFGIINQEKIEQLSSELHKMLFDPEPHTPIKTLDLPLGGAYSSADALDLIMDYLAICNDSGDIESADDTNDGEATIKALEKCLAITERITGKKSGSLGLHPAVYFYTHRGTYNKHQFLALTSLIAQKIKNNDDNFFVKFTKARKDVEDFLISNKYLIGAIMSGTGSKTRISRLQKLYQYVIDMASKKELISSEGLATHLGIRVEIIGEINSTESPVNFSDETKTAALIFQCLVSAPRCPVCNGLIDSNKSFSYDHMVPIKDGGRGNPENCRITHPYCNSARDRLERTDN